MRSLVWLRVSQGGLVRSEGGKGDPTIFVIANFIVVAVEPGICEQAELTVKLIMRNLLGEINPGFDEFSK